jgi:hypothetical protein
MLDQIIGGVATFIVGIGVGVYTRYWWERNMRRPRR